MQDMIRWGMDNLLRDGKDIELLPMVLSLCCCSDRLSNSRSTAVKSCKGLIVVLWVSIEDSVGDGDKDRSGGNGKGFCTLEEGGGEYTMLITLSVFPCILGLLVLWVFLDGFPIISLNSVKSHKSRLFITPLFAPLVNMWQTCIGSI